MKSLNKLIKGEWPQTKNISKSYQKSPRLKSRITAVIAQIYMVIERTLTLMPGEMKNTILHKHKRTASSCRIRIQTQAINFKEL